MKAIVKSQKEDILSFDKTMEREKLTQIDLDVSHASFTLYALSECEKCNGVAESKVFSGASFYQANIVSNQELR